MVGGRAVGAHDRDEHEVALRARPADQRDVPVVQVAARGHAPDAVAAPVRRVHLVADLGGGDDHPHDSAPVS